MSTEQKGKKINQQETPSVPDIPIVINDTDFNMKIIKTMVDDKNYLISPYSIEIALNMLKEGTNNNTKNQIENVVGTRKINDVSIKNRIKIANALFVKNDYKNSIKDTFYNTIKNNYQGEVIFDDFKSPDVINNWVNEHTDGMIKKILDSMDPNYVLGLANAIAIDVDWSKEFECENTRSEEFTKQDNTKYNVEMMHNNYESSAKYLKNEDATGIILPYASYNKTTGEKDYNSDDRLEFIGILPNSDVKTFISNLSKEKLNSLLSSSKETSHKFEIYLSLPRFSYEYDAKKFKKNLIDLGITDAFDPVNADFTNIMDKDKMKENLYVDTAIHKTYIDLNEKGTKAAAVTYFGMKDNAAITEEEKETVEIKFNKPFIYMIRDKKTEEILFFGVVYEPTKWTKNTCKEN